MNDTTAHGVVEWIDRETARRQREEGDRSQEVLLAAQRFSDEYADADPMLEGAREPNSNITTDLLAAACSGWKHPPDAAEFYEAMRTATPDTRQRAVAAVLVDEATCDQVLLAQLQGAFTWRQLVSMMHDHGRYEPELARYLNLWADRK